MVKVRNFLNWWRIGWLWRRIIDVDSLRPWIGIGGQVTDGDHNPLSFPYRDTLPTGTSPPGPCLSHPSTRLPRLSSLSALSRRCCGDAHSIRLTPPPIPSIAFPLLSRLTTKTVPSRNDPVTHLEAIQHAFSHKKIIIALNAFIPPYYYITKRKRSISK